MNWFNRKKKESILDYCQKDCDNMTKPIEVIAATDACNLTKYSKERIRIEKEDRYKKDYDKDLSIIMNSIKMHSEVGETECFFTPLNPFVKEKLIELGYRTEVKEITWTSSNTSWKEMAEYVFWDVCE